MEDPIIEITQVVEKLPKKRGRKPKKKVELPEGSEPEIKIPKKRGRKAKAQDRYRCKKNTLKKRGRKPKIKNVPNKKMNPTELSIRNRE